MIIQYKTLPKQYFDRAWFSGLKTRERTNFFKFIKKKCLFVQLFLYLADSVFN